MKQLLLSLIVLVLLSNSSCEKKECPEDVICSMIFVGINVQVTNAEGEPVQLSKATLSSKHLDSDMDVLSQSPPNGPYQILNDGHKQFLDNNDAREFLFEGWVGDRKVLEEKYLFRHDCCHVLLIEGPEAIQVE